MLLFFCLTFISYLVVRLLTVRFINSDPQDKWSHLCDAKLLKLKGKLEFHPMFLPVMPFTYPWGCAWLLNLFGDNSIQRFVVFNNIASSMFVWLILVWLYYTSSAFSAFLFFMLTVINPVIASPWNGLTGINARNFGAILSTAMFVVIFEFSENQVISLPLQAIIILLSIFFSKFAVQSILLISLLSIFTVPFAYSNDTTVIIALLANLSFLTLLFYGVFGSSFSKILRGSLNHSIFYSEFLQKKSIMLAEKNLSPLHFLRKISNLEIKGLAKNVVFYPFLRLFIFNPIIIVVFVILTMKDSTNLTLNYIPYLTILCFGLAVLISFDKLKFLGEADRYYDFTVGMMAAAFVSVNIDIQKTIDLLLILILFFVQAVLFVNLLSKRRSLTKSTIKEYDLEVTDWLESHAVGETIMAWPTTLSDKFVSMIDKDIKFLGLHTNADSWSDHIDDIKDLYNRIYPYPTLTSNKLKEKYSLQLCVVDKRFKFSAATDEEHRELLKEYLGDFKYVFENQQYAILKLQ